LLIPHIYINTTSLLRPRKRAYALVFEGDCSLPPPPPSSLETSVYARFEAGSSFPLSLPPFSLLLPRKRACMLVSRLVALFYSSYLPSPPFSCENEHTRSFSRVIALCHHNHHPPPSKRAHMLASRLVALCHSPYLPSPAKSSIIIIILYYLQNLDPNYLNYQFYLSYLFCFLSHLNYCFCLNYVLSELLTLLECPELL
jgi:hypothetical protein